MLNMVYIDPNLQHINFSSQDISFNNQKAVVVKYNGSGIHTITGPVPFVTINKTANKNENGYLNGTKVGINLNGKIVRTQTNTVDPAGTGIAPIVGAINKLSDLFTGSAYNGTFSIECGTTNPITIFSATGVRLNSFNANPSSDNWVFTADYTIDLEYFEKGPYNQFFISSSTDAWTVEPIEDMVYSSFTFNKIIRKETDNPKILPPLTSSINLQNNTTINESLYVKNIPQYKISRKVSAIGVPSGNGLTSINSSFQEAKKWVQSRLALSFNEANSSGVPFFSNDANLSSFDNLFLYNHFRSTNFSINDGSYEINDTWLAMPTGINYIEDFNIEMSTDDKYIKTVKVAGEIKGLNLSSFPLMIGSSSYLIPANNGKISLSGYDQFVGGDMPHTVLDTRDSPSINNTLNTNKYLNASSGWIYDIKPYLYRRASSVLNSLDRENRLAILNPSNTNNLDINANPIYRPENLLNIIPISTSEGYNPRKGTISYTYEYNNRPRMISGVYFETITINDTGPADVISEAFVLGRRLGPVLQNLGARTTSKKEITIELGLPLPSSIGGCLLTNKECPIYTGGPVYSQVETLINGLQPFGDRNTNIWGSFDQRTGPPIGNAGQVYKATDTQSWNPSDGRYTRNVSWIYQQCTNSRNWLDH